MRYLHLRKRVNGVPKTKGGKTVAYDVNGNIVTFTYSKCSKRDSYCKRVGRDIAAGRYIRAFKSGLSDKHAHVLVMQGSEKPIEAIIKALRV